MTQRAQIMVDMRSNADRVEVTPGQLSLAPGGQQTLTATAYSFNNTPLVGIGFAWTSTEPTVAQVDPRTGEVTAVGPGTAEILAQEEFGGLDGKASVTVREGGSLAPGR
jgi:uncharacterized protein YjdB